MRGCDGSNFLLSLPEGMQIEQIQITENGSVLFLGVDDFAFRRGYRFGTILVDLLPDRQAETAAAWTRQQPDIFVVSRDRGGEYEKAATLGAPQAVQCADMFHIVKNLTEATQLLLARCQAEMLEASAQEESAGQEPHKPLISIEQWRPPEPRYVEKARLARRAGRYARYQQAVEFGQQGMTRHLKLPIGWAEALARSKNGLRLERSPPARKRRKKPSSFDAFAPFVLKRWKEGAQKGITLYREIKAQGYTGSERSVYRYLATLKLAEIQAPLNVERIKKYTPNTAVWLFMRDPKTLNKIEQEDLATILLASPPLKKAYDLIQSFLAMVHKREGKRLDVWLAKVAESGLPELLSFASGIEKDKDAVRAGLTWSWSNGMVEGHVTKLKLIKRQGYGRAGFPLLRKRVLHAL